MWAELLNFDLDVIVLEAGLDVACGALKDILETI